MEQRVLSDAHSGGFTFPLAGYAHHGGAYTLREFTPKVFRSVVMS
jgi:hypothetical protein